MPTITMPVYQHKSKSKSVSAHTFVFGVETGTSNKEGTNKKSYENYDYEVGDS